MKIGKSYEKRHKECKMRKNYCTWGYVQNALAW